MRQTLKIFFLSSPFDEKNSGDYDYCASIVQTCQEYIQKNHKNIKVEYVTQEHFDERKRDISKALNKSLSDQRSKKGQEFKSEIQKCYTHTVGTLVSAITEYLLSNKAEQNILNLQLRPPETGFIFTPENLSHLKQKGFKICITCHEYKLNYTRRPLQSIMHEYFKIADRVFFFNRKDMSNACKHANHSIFLDKLLSNTVKEPNFKHLQHGFSSESHSGLKYLTDEGTTNLSISQKELDKLECDLFIGEIEGMKGKFTYSDINGTIELSDKFKFRWATTREKVSISSLDPTATIKLSGIIINARPNEKIDSIEYTLPQTDGHFLFEHEPYYEPQIKSRLSRVPPTIMVDRDLIDKLKTENANILIFGLIRDSKGFKEALDIIESIHLDRENRLPFTRLVIVGKPVDFELLADILNKKFGCPPKQVDRDDLSKVNEDSKDQYTAKIKKAILDYRLQKLKESLTQIAPCSDEIVEKVLQDMATKNQPIKVNLTNPSKLQEFIFALNNEIPEALPIDIFLDVQTEDLPSIVSQTKYAIKYDNKGWANNASALINMLSFGCILYTGWGMCTDKEVTQVELAGALILPKSKYCLKEKEKLAPYEEEAKDIFYKTKNMKVQCKKQNLITPQMIIEDIKARESGGYSDKFISTYNNIDTLELSKTLLAKFDPLVVAEQLIMDFESLYESQTLGAEEAKGGSEG